MDCSQGVVGLTAAAGVSLILAGRLEATGIVRPTVPDVYLPTLELLANEVSLAAPRDDASVPLP